MPNEHGQVVKEDYVAPEGTIRVIVESMEDGEIEIVADFVSSKYLDKLMEMLRYNEDVVNVTCSPRGLIRHQHILGNEFDENKEQSAAADTLLVYANTEGGKEFVGFFHSIIWAERLRRYLDLNFEIYEKGERVF